MIGFSSCGKDVSNMPLDILTPGASTRCQYRVRLIQEDNLHNKYNATFADDRFRYAILQRFVCLHSLPVLVKSLAV